MNARTPHNESTKNHHQQKLQQQQQQKVLVIGLGQIGYSNAEYMTLKGLHGEGFDISEKAVGRALDDGVIQKKATDFAGYDYYFICVSTHNPDDMFVPYLQWVYDLAERIGREGKRGAMLGIDSTITKGTTKKVFDIVGHKLHVVHVPHRFYVHEKDTHGVNQTRVLGGCEKCCEEKGRVLRRHTWDTAPPREQRRRGRADQGSGKHVQVRRDRLCRGAQDVLRQLRHQLCRA